MITVEDYNEAMRKCNTFCYETGIRFTRIETGSCEARCPVKPWHLNPNGKVHGGMLFTILDTVACCAGGSVEGGRRPVVTQNAAIYYLRPAQGGELRAVAQTVKSGRTTALVSVDIYNNDRLVSKGEVTIFYVGGITQDITDYFTVLKEES